MHKILGDVLMKMIESAGRNGLRFTLEHDRP